jgi:hypothetical protein
MAADAPDRVPRMLELSAMFMLMTFVVFAGYGLLRPRFAVT